MSHKHLHESFYWDFLNCICFFPMGFDQEVSELSNDIPNTVLSVTV